jgi:hypothetical protein
MATHRSRIGIVGLLVAGLIVALGLAAFASPFASSKPDGLERVAEDKGFLDTAEDSAVAESPLADYAVRNVDDARVGTGLSGVIGVLVTALVAAAVFGGVWLLVRRRDRRPPALTGAT